MTKLSAGMLRDILGSLFKRPVTEFYPFERTTPPERLRGKLVWDPAKCTGCGLCIKDCPANALELVVIDKKAKKFVMRYHADRCTYCSQCVENCRFECIEMSDSDWELAALGRQPFEVTYGRDEDVQKIMETFGMEGETPKECPEPPAEPAKA